MVSILYPALAAQTNNISQDSQRNGPEKHSSATPAQSEVERRTFQLVISVSLKDHQAHVERQLHYGSFKPNRRAHHVPHDLLKSVPAKGMSDLQIQAGERPIRFVERDRANLTKIKPLRQVWQEGMNDWG